MGPINNNEDPPGEDPAWTVTPVSKNPVHGEAGGTQEKVQAGMEPLKQQNRDWNSIREKLSPSIKDKINRQLSPSIREKINRQYEQLQEKRITESLAIIDQFNRNSINFVVLKGLTLQFFDKNRVFFDLDIFVPQTDFEKAKALLVFLGYMPEEYDLENYRETSEKHIRYNKSGKILVELHYRLFGNSSIDETDLPLIDEKYYLDISGISVPSLSPELSLLEVFLHNFYHHRFVDFDKKWYNDIETVIINQNVDWKKFLTFARRTGCCELIYKILSFLEYFNGKKSAMPRIVRQELLNNSSAIRLFLTYSFDNQLFNEYKEIKKITIPEKITQEKLLLDSKIRLSLIFSLESKKEFFNSTYQYIIAFKGFYLAPAFFIKDTFKRRSFRESVRKITYAFRSLKKERFKQRGEI